MKIFFTLLGSFAIVATLLPFIKLDHWWIRIFDYPRNQILFIALVPLAYFIYVYKNIWFDNTIIAALVLCCLYQMYIILPYTTIFKKEVENVTKPDEKESFSLVVANVLMDNQNIKGFLKIVENCNPDILLAVETNEWWKKQLEVLEEKYPHQVYYPLENTYGMILFSKMPLDSAEVRFLVEDDIPSIFAQFKLPNGKLVDLHCIHPTPPVPSENPRSTERDAELLMVGKEAKKSNNPVVVMGDLNDVAWSYTTRLFQRTSGLLDPRVGRGLYNTFNAKYQLLRWPLDHVFHSNHFKVVDLQRLPFFESDHFPMFIKLQYDHNGPIEQEEPEAEPEEKEEANEKIQKV